MLWIELEVVYGLIVVSGILVLIFLMFYGEVKFLYILGIVLVFIWNKVLEYFFILNVVI